MIKSTVFSLFGPKGTKKTIGTSLDHVLGVISPSLPYGQLDRKISGFFFDDFPKTAKAIKTTTGMYSINLQNLLAALSKSLPALSERRSSVGERGRHN